MRDAWDTHDTGLANAYGRLLLAVNIDDPEAKLFTFLYDQETVTTAYGTTWYTRLEALLAPLVAWIDSLPTYEQDATRTYLRSAIVERLRTVQRHGRFVEAQLEEGVHGQDTIDDVEKNVQKIGGPITTVNRQLYVTGANDNIAQKYGSIFDG